MLVTGAGSTVGGGVCRALCAAGAHVLLVDRGKDALAASRQALDAQFPGRAHHVVADVSEAAEARRVVGVAAERFGGLDVVVSCAAAAPSGALHTRAGDQALRASLDGGLLGHPAVARAAAELMLAQGTGGALLFTVSRGAGSPGPRRARGGAGGPDAAVRGRPGALRDPRQRRRLRSGARRRALRPNGS